jgi:uncharacterized MnhB-related membrane protein
MDTASAIFYLLATLLVIASLLVVFLRNVVHCAMALVTALLLIAVLFITLHAPMVGVLQVMIYAWRHNGSVSLRHHVSQPKRLGKAARRVVGLRHNLGGALGWPVDSAARARRTTHRSGGGHGAFR